MLIIFFPMHEFKDILGRHPKTHKKLVKTSRHEIFFSFWEYFVPPRSFFFFVVFKERKRIRNAKRTRGCLSKRVKNISRRSNTASRAFIHLKLPRVRTAVFGRLFFSVDTDLIIRLAAEGCGKIVADGGGIVFDPVPFTALEPSARPNSPRRVESSVRTGGRSRICGLASTFFSRCHKQKIGPKKICQHPMYE